MEERKEEAKKKREEMEKYINERKDQEKEKHYGRVKEMKKKEG